MSESQEQAKILLALGGTKHIRAFRNNCGVARFPNGSVVKYGLAVGSADLIGWRTVTITPDMVGRQVAVFMSIECKSAKGRVREAQEAWHMAVKKAGGIAIVARSVDDVKHLL